MPRIFPSRRTLLLLAALLVAPAIHPQSVESIFNAIPTAPSAFYWSPTGATLAFIPYDSDAHTLSNLPGQPFDLIAVSTATGKMRVLATQSQMDSLPAGTLTPQDRDHRNRYDEPDILWSPDEHSLLFDEAGKLYLYDIAHHHARPIATAQPSADDPKFSPDGNYLTYIRDHGLYLKPLNIDAPEIPIAPGTETNRNGEVDWLYLEELDTRSNYFWSPDSTRIAYLQTNESHVPQYSPDDKEFTQRYPTPGSPNPAVRITIAAIPDSSHPDTSQPITLNLPINLGNDYIPRFGWLTKTTLWIELLDRNQQRLRIFFADATTGKATCAYTETDPKFLNDNYNFTFLPPNQSTGEFLRISWQSGHSHLYLYRYNSAAPLSAPAKLVRQLTPGDFDVDTLLGVSPDNTTAFFLSNENNPIGRTLFAVSLATGRSRLVSTNPNYDNIQPYNPYAGTHDISLSPNTNAYVDSISYATGPSEVDLVTFANTAHHSNFSLDSSQRLFNSLTNIPGASQIHPLWHSSYRLNLKPIPLTLHAADNSTTLYAWLTLPAGIHSANSIPLVINPYAGPGDQDVRDQWLGIDSVFNQLLAQHGIAVLNVDNRGMAMRGRNFAQAAFNNFGPVQLADQLTAIDQTLALYPQLDGHRLGIWGWSFGGFFTTYAMQHSTRFASGIAVGTVSNWQLYDSAYTERYLGTPEKNPAPYAAGNLLTSAAQLHGHLLLVYGSSDDNVHPTNTQQLAAALTAAHIKFDLQAYPHQTHSLDDVQVRIDLYTRVLTQFEQDLKPQ